MNKDDIIRMAREAGLTSYPGWVTDGEGLENLERFAAFVAAAEREECAKVADIGADGEDPFCCLPVAQGIAAAIRARGQ